MARKKKVETENKLPISQAPVQMVPPNHGLSQGEIETLIAYRAATYQVSNSMDFGFETNSNTNDQNILSDISIIRPRMMNLARNNVIANALITNIVNNTIGEGFKLYANIPGQPKLNDLIQDEWKKFEIEADASGEHHLDELVRLIFRKSVEEGDCFGWIVAGDQGPREEFLTKVRLISAGRVYNPTNKSTDDKVYAGIVKDKYGDKKAVWFTKYNDLPYQNQNKAEFLKKAIPFKDDNGFTQVCQMYITNCYQQSRGLPLLTTQYNAIQDCDMFARTELAAAKFSANYNMFIETPNAKEMFENAAFYNQIAQGGSNGTQGFTNEFGAFAKKLGILPQRITGVNPGQLNLLMPGEKIKQVGMTRPSSSFSGFIQQQMKIITSSLGLSYAFLFHDGAELNFAASRSDIRNNQVTFEGWQKDIIRKFLTPLKEMFLVELMGRGVIPKPTNLNAFLRAVDFKLPTPAILDLNKEIQSSIMLISAGLSTHEIESQKYNNNGWLANFEQLGHELAEKEANGIPLDIANKGQLPSETTNYGNTPGATPSGEVPKPPGSGPGRIAGDGSTLS